MRLDVPLTTHHQPSQESPMKKVHHLVLLKFKASTTPQTISDLYVALARLQHVISGLESFCGGPYSSPEGLNQGFSHGFVMTFADAEARNRYLTHREHEKVKETFLPAVENVIAFDFEGGES